MNGTFGHLACSRKFIRYTIYVCIFFALLADTVPVLVIVADFSGCDCAETREEDEKQFLNPSLKILS